MSNKPKLNICGRMVGDDYPPLVIAEATTQVEAALLCGHAVEVD